MNLALGATYQKYVLKTHTVGEAAQSILARFLPEGNPSEDLAFHGAVREEVATDYEGGAPGEREFSVEEVKEQCGP